MGNITQESRLDTW